MPVTLTIKQVPDALAQALRLRAAASHRSLQGEMMAILESAVSGGIVTAREPEAGYAAKAKAGPASKVAPAHGKRLTVAELWERSRRLGPPGKSESVTLVRALRNERHGR